MEKIDETRPLRRSDADLQPLWPKLWMRTGHDEIDANEKILAIGTINPGVDPAKVFAVLPNEVRDTVDLYLNGKIDQWYSRADGKGVVFFLRCSTVEEARAIMGSLPLDKAGMVDLEFIPVGPLSPMRLLTKPQPGETGAK